MADADSIRNTRTCTKCGARKSLDSFGVSSRNKTGRKPHCKACACAEEKSRRLARGNEIRQRERQRRQERIEVRRQQERAADLRRRQASDFHRKFREAATARLLDAHRIRGRVNACRVCSVEFCPVFGRHSWMETCSDECRGELARKRARIKRHVRRARVKGVRAVRVDPIAVFARDNWRCQLCGRATLKSKRGTAHPRAPELDHIIPLARGGEHSPVNTQCACRECNGRKGATPLGQLILLGDVA